MNINSFLVQRLFTTIVAIVIMMTAVTTGAHMYMDALSQVEVESNE